MTFAFMSPTTISCHYSEHRIDAVLTEKDLRLYIDNNLVESSRVYLIPASDQPLLRGVFSRQREHTP